MRVELTLGPLVMRKWAVQLRHLGVLGDILCSR